MAVILFTRTFHLLAFGNVKMKILIEYKVSCIPRYLRAKGIIVLLYCNTRIILSDHYTVYKVFYLYLVPMN